jgi:hypothetical protein
MSNRLTRAGEFAGALLIAIVLYVVWFYAASFFIQTYLPQLLLGLILPGCMLAAVVYSLHRHRGSVFVGFFSGGVLAFLVLGFILFVDWSFSGIS